MKELYSKEDIIKCGEGKLFEGRIKLPAGNMSMIDRIISIDPEGGSYGQGQLIAEFDITSDLWFFECHFKDDPVMPGCLGLDALWQLTGFYMGWKGMAGVGRALGLKELKLSEPVLPDAGKITYRIDIKKVTNRKLKIGLSDGYVELDGKVIYSAKDLKVGLF